jgi:hypothetical protein
MNRSMIMDLTLSGLEPCLDGRLLCAEESPWRERPFRVI